MMANQNLIATIVVGLGFAFVFGALAHRLRIPLLIGYLIAGVIIGPFTPGYVADQALARQLAEVGVILLMFGVGLHFSLHDLLSVRAIAIPGAIGQMALVSALGFSLAHAMGSPIGASVVFGLALSVASTVVVIRALQERRLIDTDRGRIVVGWLIVEDLAMVLVLVLLPALALLLGGQVPPEVEVGWFGGFLDPHSIWSVLGLTLAKLAAYLLLSWSSDSGLFLSSCTTWRTQVRASCSASRCSRWLSMWRSARPSCSACRLRSALSSPVWCWPSRRSVSRPHRKHCH